ncbi:MAG: YihY/virulence factor BrkB family protein, partial [Parafilimonas sp.]
EGRLFSQINGFIGNDAAKQVQDIVKNIHFSGKTNFALAGSIVVVIIGATSVFVEIQDSINFIWRVKAKPKRGWQKFLKNRLLSSSLIISLGFLLIVSLVLNGIIQALSAILTRYLSNVTVIIINLINLFIGFALTAVLFAIIFKVLPDVKIKWKDVKIGAIFTAILFMIGKYLIGLYIKTTGTGSTYGAAGSIIIILVWIYLASAILYLGAEFTQVYSEAYGGKIQPAEYAVFVQRKEVEREVNALPPQHPEITKNPEIINTSPGSS